MDTGAVYCPPGTRVLAVFISTTDLTDWTDQRPVAIEEIKKFVVFPGLTPLQPDAYAQP